MIYEWLSHISFTWKYAFIGFALFPLLIYFYIRRNRKSQSSLIVSSAQSFTVRSRKNIFRHSLFVLRLLTLTCLILALARPQKTNTEELSSGEGIDIVLSLDVSGSMLSKDFEPNRLEVAKELVAGFIRSRPVDRIGLVIFSGEAYTQVPLTTDKQTLLSQVNSLQSGLLLDGTLIGEGLATAADRLRLSKAKSKVIVLLTDGKEEAPETRLIDPLTALEIAKAVRVKVYTIGMSAMDYVPVAEKGQKARQAGDAFLDEQLLKKIASETGGRYFRATDKNGLKEVYDQINQLEKSKVDIQALRKFEERFLPFVLAALFFLFLEMLLRYTVFRKFP